MSDETTTAIAKTARPAPSARLTLNELVNYAGYFANSGMFSDKKDNFEVAQAKIMVRIMYGQEIGLEPASACIGVHVIEGKPALSSAAISARIKASGIVNYVEVEMSDQRCELMWTEHGKEIGRSWFTIDDAKRAGLSFKTYKGNDGMWTKYPRAMLFARALTEGQKRYAPHVFGGAVYTEEELGRSEVVHVSQPDRPVQVDRDKERTAARNNLVEVIGRCTTNRDERVRVYKTVLKKCDKGDKQMTTAEYREYAGMVKAFHEDDNLTQWCDTFGPAAVRDAEVVDAEVVEPNADDWKRANGMFHAELTTFLKAGNHETKGDEYKIIKDVVRDQCALTFDAEWSEVSAEQMRKVAKLIAAENGNFAKIGVDGEWRDHARSRGAIE